MFTRTTPLIVYLQIIVLLVLLNYYFNPLILNSHCLAAHAESPTLGSGTIIDCAACLNLDSRDIIQSRLTGNIDVLLPLRSLDASGQRGRLPVDNSQGSGSGALAEKVMMEGLVFGQGGCLEYECRSELITNDFTFSQSEHRNKLESLGMKLLKQVKFQQSNSPVKNMLAAKPATGKYRRIGSTSFSSNSICSIMVRFRYNPIAQLDSQTQPLFTFHQITDNLILRLLLIAPLIFDFIRFSRFLAFHNIPYSDILTLLLCLSFISQKLAIAGSFLALCMMGSLMAEQRAAFMMLGISFPALRIVQEFGQLPMFLSPLLIVVINGLVVYFWRGKDTKVEVYQLVLINSIHGLLGIIYTWNFLISVCPLLMFFGLSLLWTETQLNASQSYSKSNFHEIEEEEDVLMRIDRALEKH